VIHNIGTGKLSSTDGRRFKNTKTKFMNENRERVRFRKEPIKKIVSHHSGSILAKPEPILTLDLELEVLR
jgi:hypothetical protein